MRLVLEDGTDLGREPGLESVRADAVSLARVPGGRRWPARVLGPEAGSPREQGVAAVTPDEDQENGSDAS